jgi:hypothetical protein
MVTSCPSPELRYQLILRSTDEGLMIKLIVELFSSTVFSLSGFVSAPSSYYFVNRELEAFSCIGCCFTQLARNSVAEISNCSSLRYWRSYLLCATERLRDVTATTPAANAN